jgi:hypothetical protein
MELLIAFLIAFGLYSSDSKTALTEKEAVNLIESNNLQKDFIIFGQEHDDF